LTIPFALADASTGSVQIGRVGESESAGHTAREERDLLALVADSLGLYVQRRHAEESRRIADAALASSVTAIGLCDLEGSLTYANDAFLRLWGFESLDEIRGRPAPLFGDSPDDVADIFEEVLNKGQWKGEMVARRGDGTRSEVEMTATLVRDPAGRPVRVMGTFVSLSELRRSQARLAEAQRVAHIGNWDWNIVGGSLWWSDEIYRIFGLEPQQFEATYEAFLRTIHPDDRKLVTDAVNDALEGRAPYAEDHRVVWPDGTVRTVHEQGEVFYDATRTPVRMIGTVQDVTEQRQAVEALRKSEERYALAAKGANDGLWDWDLVAKTMHFSPRWADMLGYAIDDLRSDPDEWFGRVHPNDLENVRRTLDDHLEGRLPHFETEHRIRSASGDYRWMLCRGVATRDARGRPMRMAGSQTDISDRRTAKAALEHQAFHDPLTGLSNRLSLAEYLRHSLLDYRDNDSTPFSVLFIDLDRFKNVNDGLGHNAGDVMLIEVARRFGEVLRSSDVLARLGGDEFTAIVRDADADQASEVARRLIECLRSPIVAAGRPIFTSASIGIAVVTPQYDRAEDLLRDADTAMYDAKAAGRGGWSLFDPAMHARAASAVVFDSDLRHAVERDECELHYQPVWTLEPRRIVSFEALLRWRHPEHGPISPAVFIPIAEESGLIVPLGRWVLREACRWLAQRRRTGADDMTVCVNVSVRQFAAGTVADDVRAALAESDLPGSALTIEITESVLMNRPDAVMRAIAAVKALGVLIALDDFGTGYSSLGYLNSLPIDKLKMDRSFIMPIEENQRQCDLVSGIITMAHSLGISVVAEGVETAGQLEVLERLNCDMVQGYHLGRPASGLQALALAVSPVESVA